MIPLRIRKPSLQVVFVITTAVAAGLLINVFQGSVGGILLGETVSLGWWVLVVRCLRGPDEPLGPPRPWWRATYRPTASIWLAGAFGVGLVGLLVSTLADPLFLRVATGEIMALFLADVLFCLAYVAYFALSAVMLRRRVTAVSTRPAASGVR